MFLFERQNEEIVGLKVPSEIERGVKTRSSVARQRGNEPQNSVIVHSLLGDYTDHRSAVVKSTKLAVDSRNLPVRIATQKLSAL